MKLVRGIVNVLFLMLFFGLMFLGKPQLWMGFIFLSLLLTPLLGRFYCGWACPINTIIQPVSWISKKLGLHKKEVPNIFKTEKIRWTAFAFFLVGLGYTIYSIKMGEKFPLPLIIIPIGVVTTLLINEKTWHRYFCPWGVLFSFTGRFSKRGIEANACTGCSICAKTCPGDAITINSMKKADIDPTHCLLCLECIPACPQNTMSYGKKSGNKKSTAKAK